MLAWYRKWQARRFLRQITRTRRDTPDKVLIFLANDIARRLPPEQLDVETTISSAMRMLRVGKK